MKMLFCLWRTPPPPPPLKPPSHFPAMWILPSLKRWLCQKMRQCATSKKCKFLYVNIVWILIRIQLNLDGGWGRWGERLGQPTMCIPPGKILGMALCLVYDIVSLGCLSLEYNLHVH